MGGLVNAAFCKFRESAETFSTSGLFASQIHERKLLRENWDVKDGDPLLTTFGKANTRLWPLHFAKNKAWKAAQDPEQKKSKEVFLSTTSYSVVFQLLSHSPDILFELQTLTEKKTVWSKSWRLRTHRWQPHQSPDRPWTRGLWTTPSRAVPLCLPTMLQSKLETPQISKTQAEKTQDLC